MGRNNICYIIRDTNEDQKTGFRSTVNITSQKEIWCTWKRGLYGNWVTEENLNLNQKTDTRGDVWFTLNSRAYSRVYTLQVQDKHCQALISVQTTECTLGIQISPPPKDVEDATQEQSTSNYQRWTWQQAGPVRNQWAFQSLARRQEELLEESHTRDPCHSGSVASCGWQRYLTWNFNFL